jgi:hypothetical protein
MISDGLEGYLITSTFKGQPRHVFAYRHDKVEDLKGGINSGHFRKGLSDRDPPLEWRPATVEEAVQWEAHTAAQSNPEMLDRYNHPPLLVPLDQK